MRNCWTKTRTRIVGNREADRFSGRCKEKGSEFHQHRKPDLAESALFFSPTYLRRCAGPRRRGDKRAGRIWPSG